MTGIQGYAQTSGTALGASQPEQERTMDRLVSSLVRSNSTFMDGLTRLQNFTDRLQGSTPMPVKEDVNRANAPHLTCIESRLAEATSVNQKLAEELHELITKLERSL